VDSDKEKGKDKLSTSVSLIDSIEADLGKIGADVGEVGVDFFLESDLARSIPIVKILLSGYGLYRSTRDYFFTRKVLSYLSEFTDVPQEKRSAFAAKLSADAGTREKAGAALMLLLDRLDDLEKPVIVGRLYRAHLEGRISYTDLRRFCMIVDRAFLPDLVELSRSRDLERLSRESAEHLHSLGLFAIAGEDLMGWPDGSPGSKITYALNSLGDRFLSVALPAESS